MVHSGKKCLINTRHGSQLAQIFFGSPLTNRPSFQGYHEYIDENLPPESPYLYGLHPNAEIGFLTVTSEKLFRTVLEMQPKETDSGAGTGVSREEKAGPLMLSPARGGAGSGGRITRCTASQRTARALSWPGLRNWKTGGEGKTHKLSSRTPGSPGLDRSMGLGIVYAAVGTLGHLQVWRSRDSPGTLQQSSR